MKKNQIYLIGLNLYSIFMALKIRSDNKNINISIIEGSKNFLNAYKELKISKYSVNPGFHALEDIRSKKLIKLLSKQTKFKKIFKTRGILIGDNLISWQDEYNKWPKKILNKFKIKKANVNLDPKKNIKYLNKNYLRYLINNFFGKNVKIEYSINSAFPWFFPKNYNIISNDEGAIFNKKIREKKIKHAFVFPKNGLFSIISKSLKILLKKYNIKVKLNNPIQFEKNNDNISFKGNEKLNLSENKKIVCIPVVPLSYSINLQKFNLKLKPIKYFTCLVEIRNDVKNELDKFCEVITSSELAYGLTRVSQYSEIFNIKNKKIYQIEFIEHPKEKDIDLQIKKIMKLLSKFIIFKDRNNLKNINLIGFSLVRNVFRPSEKYINKLSLETNKYFRNQKNIVFPRKITWPINSNKHLLYAEKDYKDKILKFLND